MRVLNGPFSEAAGSFFAIKADDLDAAVAHAQRLPMLPGDSIEVRPIMKARHDAKKTEKPGRLFAFVVVGHSSNEEEWIRLMNGIDAEANGRPTRYLTSGLRLEAPRAGRRLVAHHEGEVVVRDDPFVAGKAVIGGMFFFGMDSLDDAVEWTRKTEFVKVVAAEIREVRRGA
jgi:hypothetical protein